MKVDQSGSHIVRCVGRVRRVRRSFAGSSAATTALSLADGVERGQTILMRCQDVALDGRAVVVTPPLLERIRDEGYSSG